MKANRPKLAPRVRLQIDAITGQPVLLHPEGILQLNETAHEVVKRCDGCTTAAEIAIVLSREYEIEPDQIERDVRECLNELMRRNLVTLQ